MNNPVIRAIILVGAASTGKSSFTRDLWRGFGQVDVDVCSADSFPGLYTGPKGYEIEAAARAGIILDPPVLNWALLGKAHAQSVRDWIETIRELTTAPMGTMIDTFVVCDNTNTSLSEISPYIMTARAYGIEPEVVVMDDDLTVPAAALAARNGHGCPAEGIQAQRERIVAMLEAWPPFYPVPIRAKDFC